MCCPASAASCLPTAVDPVKVILRIAGWAIRYSEMCAGWPYTSPTTPGGMPASTKQRSNSAGEAGVSSGALHRNEHPAASAAPSLRTIWLIGKFHGVNAATGPTGSGTTSCCTWPRRLGTQRPYRRSPSSANHSMMSAPARTSAKASCTGLPCSRVISGAIALARARSSPAARRKMAWRSCGASARHTSKPRCAAATARSKSTCPAHATWPNTWSVAGLVTASVAPLAASCHTPSISN